jgi:hypothetical protein
VLNLSVKIKRKKWKQRHNVTSQGKKIWEEDGRLGFSQTKKSGFSDQKSGAFMADLGKQ